MGIMKTTKRILALTAISGLTVTSANAALTMTLNGNNVLSYGEVLPSQTLPNGATWTSGGVIGVYQFTVNSVAAGDTSGLTTGQTFWSTCLSPGGDLDFSPHIYDFKTFQQANPGVNPSAWATGPGGELWGIQNANYLWRTFGSGTSALQNPGASPQDTGAALAMAMYVALYDSTGYAALGGSKFSPAGLSQNVQNLMTSDLLALTSADVANNLAPGYMLVPQNPSGAGSGQEFIVLAPLEGTVVPVPEPGATAMFGGAIALLSWVASAAFKKFSAVA